MREPTEPRRSSQSCAMCDHPLHIGDRAIQTQDGAIHDTRSHDCFVRYAMDVLGAKETTVND